MMSMTSEDVTMDLQKITDELRYFNRKFPENAVREAMDKPELVTAEFLKVIQEVIESPEQLLDEKGYMLPTYALFLLSYFREERAYPLVMKMFSVSGDIIMEGMGEFVTEDLQRVIASVFDGDLDPIKRLIEDPSVEVYVRSACLGSLTILVAENLLDRTEAIAYFQSLFTDKLEKDPCYIWASLVCSCIDLGAYELFNEVKKAFDQKLVDKMAVSLKDFENARDRGDDITWFKKTNHSRRIGDVVDEMSGWACFQEQPNRYDMNVSSSFIKDMLNKAAERHFNEKYYEPVETVVNDSKVGRNEQCPCGSGKKYKRCCLN